MGGPTKSTYKLYIFQITYSVYLKLLHLHLQSMAKSKSSASAVSGVLKAAPPREASVPQEHRETLWGIGEPVQPKVGKKPMESQMSQKSLSNYVQMMADPKNGPLEGRPDSNAYPTNIIRVDRKSVV